MPNYCSNNLDIKCTKKQAKEISKFVRGVEPRYKGEPPSIDERTFCLHKILPVPANILAQTYNDAGYAWQTTNWGTKWDTMDACLGTDSEGMQFAFTTAWSPIHPKILKILSNKFKTADFRYWFVTEAGDGGQMQVKGGKFLLIRLFTGAEIEAYQEGEDMDLKWLDSKIPKYKSNVLGDFPKTTKTREVSAR